MAWNEPGGGNGGKDPWGKRNPDGGPPDLDEVIRKMQDKLGGLFGGRRRPGTGGPGAGGGTRGLWLVGVLAVIAFLGWDMAYIIEPAQRGVVLRFGAHAATLEPGLNFRLPRPIESVTKVDVDQIRSISHKATMLTADENIVDVEIAMQYRIKDVGDYVFKVRGPDASVRQVTESALRDMVGTSKLDFVLTEGRTEIAAGTRQLLQDTLDRYQAGVIVTSANMAPAKPPDEVKSAFDDAIKAREDEQRHINNAHAYRNDLLPRARGGAARLMAEANAYRFKVIAEAEGRASRFSALRAEYERAPEVTRQRLYLDAIESVLSRTTKVILDAKGTNNLLYLPLDKIIERKDRIQSSDRSRSSEQAPQQTAATPDLRERTDVEDRGMR